MSDAAELSSSTGAVTVAFVDLAGFTALTDTHGDHHAADLAGRFADLARGSLRQGEDVIKTIGDAVMLSAPTPTEGVALVGRICARTDAEAAFPVVRAGLRHGPVVERDGDLFGATVNLASRVAAQAAGGQVLATAAVADAAATAGFDARPLGAVALRNLPDPVELYELAPCPQPHDRAVDPVCRMAVDRATAAGRLTHLGHDHWFCSLACVAAFATNPDRYPSQESDP